MPKVDERSPTVILDQAGRRRLARALDVDGVAAAYLIGSQARGNAGPLSDIDVAVWMSPSLDRRGRWELLLSLIRSASSAIGSSEVDVIPLDDADPVMRHRAVRDGMLLIDRDPKVRIGRETDALLEYLDTAPLRATIDAGRRHRLEEGRFGRP